MSDYYIYIMTNQNRSTLYIGVTNSLVKRVSQHRRGDAEGFTARYNLTHLVYFETYSEPRDAISREKQLKKWSRAKKDALIAKKNAEWTELGETMLEIGPAPIGAMDTEG